MHRKFNLMLLSIGGVTALYLSVFAGSFMPLELPGELFGLTANANWIILLFIYAAIASMLPVWSDSATREMIVEDDEGGDE